MVTDIQATCSWAAKQFWRWLQEVPGQLFVGTSLLHGLCMSHYREAAKTGKLKCTWAGDMFAAGHAMMSGVRIPVYAKLSYNPLFGLNGCDPAC